MGEKGTAHAQDTVLSETVSGKARLGDRAQRGRDALFPVHAVYHERYRQRRDRRRKHHLYSGDGRRDAGRVASCVRLRHDHDQAQRKGIHPVRSRSANERVSQGQLPDVRGVCVHRHIEPFDAFDRGRVRHVGSGEHVHLFVCDDAHPVFRWDGAGVHERLAFGARHAYHDAARVADRMARDAKDGQALGLVRPVCRYAEQGRARAALGSSRHPRVR